MSPVFRRALRASPLFVLIAVAVVVLIGRSSSPRAHPGGFSYASLSTGAAGAPPPPGHPDDLAPPSPSSGGRPAAGAPSLRGVARNPNAVDVLVNKQVRLPAGFRPRDLVVPHVPFVFSGFDEKRQVRRVMARPLERLFAAAARDGVPLAGVSGYRSEETQRNLFAYYVRQMGVRAASRVSARPGYSEHETGLAIDVTGADGRCPAGSCFAATPAARWLAAHAPSYGFIVRYPANGTASTGYSYEPWHLRYLGRRLASAVAASGLTYEQYLGER